MMDRAHASLSGLEARGSTVQRWFVLLALILPLSVEPTFASNPIVSQPSPYDPDWPTVYWILMTKCRSCHNPGQSERQDLSTYQSLMTACVDDDEEMPVVCAGHPEESALWDTVCWNVHASQDSDLPDTPMMPIEKDEWLTAGQLDAVHRWIENGAHEFASPARCRPLTELEFPSAKVCASCHPKQYDEWSRSMHAYAQHSPVFEAFNLTLIERTSGTIGTFCTRCHTPIGTALGENGSVRNVDRSRISMEGVTCVTCHRRSTRHYKNNGRVPVEPGRLETACMYGPFDGQMGEDVGGHGAARLPYIKSSQFCGECHDVVTPPGVRNEEAFSEWQQSPAAREGITCQSCHMGPVQGVPCPDSERPLGRAASVPNYPADAFPLRNLTDHTFAGPDYSLLPDTEFPHKLDWMYETDYSDPSKLTPYQQASLRRLRRRNRASLEKAFEKRLELLGNAVRLHVRHPARAKAGSRIKIRADIRSVFSGHNFPTGFMAERQAWIAIAVQDPDGQVVFASGDLDHNQDLRDGHSHDVLVGKVPYDRYLLNLQGEFTSLTNKGTDRSLVIPVNRHLMPVNILRPSTEGALSFGRPSTFRIAKGSLPPLKTLGQTYPVRLDACGVYTIYVKLRFRHLPPTLLDHIGTPHLKGQLQVIDMATYCGRIRVGESTRNPMALLKKGFH